MSNEDSTIAFQALTPMGFVVRVTTGRWGVIVTAKHPVMAGRAGLVQAALENPDEVRQSRSDPQVLLFYKAEATKRWTCAVARRSGDSGLLVTTYPTDAIKEGGRIWPK